MTTAQREQQREWLTVTTEAVKPGFHKCPVPTCSKQVSNDKLMCAWHWFRLPQHLQTSIYRTYFAGLRRNQHPTDEYIDYVEQALDHIAQLSAPKPVKQGALPFNA